MESEAKQVLKEIGLSEKEIAVYISLLELGEAPVKDITIKSELNRVTVYPVLKSLIDKGFVSQFNQDKKTFFKPMEPRQILENLKQKETRVNSIIPLLESVKGRIKSKTAVEIFRGSKGISSFFDKIYSGDEKQFYAYGKIDIARQGIKYQSLNARNLRKMNYIMLNAVIDEVKKEDEEYINKENYKKLTKIWVNPELKNIEVFFLTSVLAF